MQDFVLIVAKAGDLHALAVAARIESKGFEVLVWDSSRLPETDQITQVVSQNGMHRTILETRGMGTIDLAQARSVWWRRPSQPTIPKQIDDSLARSYCRYETTQLLRGTLSSLGPIVHNDPDYEEIALRKPYHLKVATEVGLCVVPTIMTSSPDQVRTFRDGMKNEGIVFKPFQAPSGSGCTTQEFLDEYDEKLSLLANAPVIFQQKVPPNRDVRVSVIGDKIFAGISASENLDWRIDTDLEWTSHELPTELYGRILKFMKRLRLTMGHLDFRIASDGSYVFFEINPSGQFLFLEVYDRELPITSEIADLLIA